MEAQWPSAGGVVLTDGFFWWAAKPPYGGTVDSLTYQTGVGSFTVEVDIAGTPVTGLSAVAVSSSTPTTTNATGANTFTAGQVISGTVTGATGSPSDVMLSLAVTWAP